mgnify:CR=1 FL=1
MEDFVAADILKFPRQLFEIIHMDEHLNEAWGIDGQIHKKVLFQNVSKEGIKMQGQ